VTATTCDGDYLPFRLLMLLVPVTTFDETTFDETTFDCDYSLL